MVCKKNGIHGFLGTLWVLIIMPPLGSQENRTLLINAIAHTQEI